MIFETELIRKKLKEESYIGEIIFTRDENIINEVFIINGNKLKVFVRNKKEEKINHHCTFKLKGSLIPFDYGIPIMFDKIIDGYDKDGNEIYHFDWSIDPDVYKNISKRDINKIINSKVIEFINKVLLIAGNDMIEYWALDPKKDNKRINELENKYQGYKI